VIGAAKLILAGVGTYAVVLGSTLLYVYIRQPGHGAITRLLPVLVLMLASMALVTVSSCVGAYQLVTVPHARTRMNVAVVVAGFVVTVTWLLVSGLG